MSGAGSVLNKEMMMGLGAGLSHNLTGKEDAIWSVCGTW